MFVTVDEAKRHINIDTYFNEDNDYILHLISAAESAVALKLNVRSLSDLVDPYTGGIPDSVKHSILILVADWYASRESFAFQNIGKLPFSFEFLANLNKNYKSPF